ncbi:MAG: leucine--tRNA ligase [Alphaproteobacteria bacterium]|jgi:leucyl-tRNA synthetase|nr:leucine--tRNA ligase [Alphaproteobacteria bacterium]
MEKSYSFKIIEDKWQKKWQEKNIFSYSQKSSSPKYYILEMIPYPSGKLHMGHVRNYTLGDVLARYKKNKNYNVLHPMGWDAFGLPAENAAKENNSHPKKWTYDNISYMKSQFAKLGFSIDWDVEVITCSPDYYKLEQAIFIDFFKAGLAYKKESWVNWDPVENTVLANEQVVDGRGWRSGALIEQKQLNQWFLKITDFAEDLLNDLSLLKGWPEKVKNMQQNWIGKSYGANIFFDLKGENEKITVYSTTPEAIYGASFLALSIHHPKAIELAEKNPLIADFIKEAQANGTIEENINKEEKKGIDTGLIAINPVNGKELKVFICNYVLDYGTASIFGCPSHDAKDYDFAKKYNLPLLKIMESEEEFFEGEGIMINSDFLDGLNSLVAREKIITYLTENNMGEGKINYRLKDWGVSRQRYWGCPIPIVYCDTCGVVPEKKENLPITLPDDVDFNTSGNPLNNHPTWKHTTCPNCGGKATRETDTFDTFFESAWYFLRYPSVLESESFAENAINYWAPVDQYIGGIEHAVMHLLYARFFVKALAKLGILGEKNKNLKEPFMSLMTQGMIAHKTYKSVDGKWLYPTEVIFDEKNQPIHADTKHPVVIGKSEKMSKSKKNTVDPDYICKIYGADTARMFVLSDSPPDKDLEWTDMGVEGIYKFINRYWRLAVGVAEYEALDISKLNEVEISIYSKIQQYIVEIENNINELHLNKAVALNRELFNLLEAQKKEISPALLRYGVEILTQTLNPFIPHITEEVWEMLGKEGLLANTTWCNVDNKYLANNKITIAIQILGKTKGSIEVDSGISQDELLIAIKEIPAISKILGDAVIKKVIYVPKRIINVLI